MTSDDRLIVALDVPNALQGLALADQLGEYVSYYEIGLGMLTGGRLALPLSPFAARSDHLSSTPLCDTFPR